MKKMLLIGVFLLASSSVTTAHAATACFDWECLDGDGACTIDASCSSASPFVWKYAINFGDGSGTGLTGNSTHQHQYGGGVYEATVTLSIYYWTDPSVSTVACTIHPWLPPVGPQPPPSYFQGRCTQ